ncbi:MAG: molybdopterin-dependent oxidoreductase [Candidatus Sericytochromatia bacterium]|uniref:Molybdopterin-dependent oxidoreductase n=1 Tax=Candidatus Tanganyikabacteria bacterium TaxID=2961651 RepID=A0A937X2H5_9BACT|nr:molybdopterin-dependent oxidoreductase [Candidatus Tanganyikabacteria bacterium]
MDRRTFLKASGLASSAVLLGACEDHLSELVPYSDLPAELVYGEGTYFATACDMCSSGCGAMARVVEGRVPKVEGLPDHPVNHGGLCPLGQSAVQHQYHPDRFKGPQVRAGRGQSAAEAKWPDAIAKLVEGLRTAGGGGTAILVGNQVRGHRYGLIAKFAQQMGAPAPLIVEPLGNEAVRTANAAVYGRPEIPYYDLAHTDLLVLFGEDLFTTGSAPMHYTHGYAKMRRGRDLKRGSLVYVGTRYGEAATIADLFIPVKPGTHGAIAQALLHDEARGGIAEALAAELTGCPAEKLHRLTDLWKQASTAVAIGGGEVLGHTNAVQALTAIASLNVAKGSVGKPGGVYPPAAPPLPGLVTPNPASYRDLHALADKMRSGAIKAVLLIGVDPFQAFPASAKLEEAFKAVHFVASFAQVPDDGAGNADLILPDSHFLERWGDTSPAVGVGAGVAGLIQPAVNPFFDTRAVEDTLIEAAKGLGKNLGFETAAAYFKQMWAAMAPDTAAPGAQSAWRQALRKGGIVKPGHGAAYAPKQLRVPAPTAPEFDGDEKARPFALLPVRSLKYREGRASHLPWMQEMADPMSSAAWGGWAEINPHTCEKLGLKQYDEVEIESDHGKVVLGVVPFPGLPEDVVGVPIGYSAKHGTRYDSEAGGNVFDATQKADPGRGADARALLADKTEPAGGGLAWGATRVSLRKTGKRVPLGKLVLHSRGIAPQESVSLPHKIHQEFKVWPIG